LSDLVADVPLLAWLGIDAFELPERLPWLVLLVAAGAALAFRQRRPCLPWPALPEARDAGARPLELVPPVAAALRALSLACLAAVLLGPLSLHEAPPEPGLGLDLVLVVDTSGSMRSLDAELGDRARTRLELAKEVVTRFATHRIAEGDRVGLVVFGQTAFTQCPLTSDGALLAAALARVRVGMAGEATALGDALALATKRVRAAPGGAGKVVVLLTDGRSNAGAVPVDVAAELAAGSRVRVHTVGIGSGGEVPVAVSGAAGRGLRFERHDPDPETLEHVAKLAGGRFFAARRAEDLRAVYAEIDAIERAPRPLPARRHQTRAAEPLLAGAGALLLLEIGLARVARRRVP
jgi:Ca-activated chloride channel family protein